MTKRMAKIKDGKVVNIEEHPYNKEETENLKNIMNNQIVIGSDYKNGYFYNDNKLLISIYDIPLFLEKIEACLTYTQMMTDTLIE